MNNDTDLMWMQQAIALAKKGLYTTRANPRVGCVLVKNQKKIAEGFHVFPGGPHAEVVALQQAGNEAHGATCYVSLAPCTHYGKTPPCADALIQAGITRVVAATRDPNPLVDDTTSVLFGKAGITYETGVCHEEAMQLNPGFFMRMQHQRPFVRLKTAMSLDGRTAMQNGQSQWITGPSARALVQQLRAQSCAILTGINTVLMDDPSLTVRDEEILSFPNFQQPVRVILDTQLRIPLNAKLLQLPGKVWIYTGANDPEKTARLKEKGAQVFIMPPSLRAQRSNPGLKSQSCIEPGLLRCARNDGAFARNDGAFARHDGVDLHAVLTHLASQQINEVLVEAGSIVNGALLQENLVDEWHLFVAPKIMGDAARGLCTLSITELSQTIDLKIQQHFQVGDDWCYIATVGK